MLRQWKVIRNERDGLVDNKPEKSRNVGMGRSMGKEPEERKKRGGNRKIKEEKGAECGTQRPLPLSWSELTAASSFDINRHSVEIRSLILVDIVLLTEQ